MVGNNDGHPHAFSVGNLILRRNPVITCNNRIDIIIQSPVDQINIQPVAIPDPVWNIIIHPGSKAGKPFQKNICGIDAINVIIPDNADALTFCDLLFQQIDSLVHVFHQHPVVQIRNGSVQVPVHRFLPDNIPVADQCRRPWMNMKPLPYFRKIAALSEQYPVFHLYSSTEKQKDAARSW